MFKKVRKICSFVILISCILFPCVKADAKGTSAAYEFYVNYSEPSTNGYNGYINVMYQGGGGYRLYTYFWTFQSEGNTDYAINNGMYMVVQVNSTSLIFNPITTIAGGGQLTLACYDWNDDLHVLKTQHIADLNNEQVLVEDYSGSRILGYSYKGNVQLSSGTQLKDVPIPEIYWNNSVDSYWLSQEINAILGTLGNIDVDTTDTIIRLENIYNQNIATHQKLEDLKTLSRQIKAEQEETNTWLEKIFNWLKDSPEQEKQEAQTQGGNSVAEGTNAIEDKGQGFSDSMGGLINSMSYNGTECSWTFPTVKLPAISGVMDERTLIESQKIDFSIWINAIPPNIMLLIQSVLTIALIVYCFKEFYSTIEYVLTLRRAKNE